MIRRSAHFGLLVLIYLAGIVILFGASIWYLFIDYAGKDWIALLVVLPFAWLFSYWPMVGSILMIFKIRRLQGFLDEVAQRAKANGGEMVESDKQELTDLAAEMVASETYLPRFLARRVVRYFIRRMNTQPPTPSSASPS